MGTQNGPYNADFPAGTRVRIATRAKLAEFRKSWMYHHPLTEAQFACAGADTLVLEVSYYFGGDELYRLEGLPGYWHACCLSRAG